MRVIELNPSPPEIAALLQAIEEDDVLLVRDGHAIVRLEKFDDEDWADWNYEHSPEAIALGTEAREQYRRGDFSDVADARGNGAAPENEKE